MKKTNEIIEINIPTPRLGKDEQIYDFQLAFQKAQKKTMEFARLRSVEQINYGYCGTFVDFFEDIYSGPEKYQICHSEDPPHFYISCNGLFYDADRPKGVKSLEDLPTFAEAKNNQGHSVENLLYTEEGRAALAAAMVEPLRREIANSSQVRTCRYCGRCGNDQICKGCGACLTVVDQLEVPKKAFGETTEEGRSKKSGKWDKICYPPLRK